MNDRDLAAVLAERTRELCAIDSVIGNEREIADAVERWAGRAFTPGEIFRLGNALVCGRMDDPRPTLALFGHLDTVPHPPGGAPPAEQVDGRVRGLGSSDMKSGLAVMMQLAETLPRQLLAVNLVLAFYDREEGPYATNGLGPLLAARDDLSGAALAICLEPSDGAVQMGCCGALHATLRFAGRRAHSARPWQGENAIHKAGSVLTELLNRERVAVVHDGLTFYEVMTATLASAPGAARNVVPDNFEVNLNYRFAPGKSAEAAQADVRAFVAGRAEVHVTDLAPSGPVALGNPLAARLVKLSGRAPEPKQAWTDVARLAAAGLDAVNFGPGETAQAHQADESVAVAAIVRCYKVLERLCAEGSPA